MKRLMVILAACMVFSAVVVGAAGLFMNGASGLMADSKQIQNKAVEVVKENVAQAAPAGFSEESARQAAARMVPSTATYVGGHYDDGDYEMKFYDNSARTEYEVSVSVSTNKVRKFSMEVQGVWGSSNVVLSENDARNVVLREYPQATVNFVKLDRDDGVYEYEAKFSLSDGSGEMKINPETGRILEKEIRYWN